MATEPLVYMMCNPVSDGPSFVAGAEVHKCVFCNTEVWVSPSCKELLLTQATGGPACAGCYWEHVPAGEELEIIITDAQLAEARSVLGQDVSRESITEMMKHEHARRKAMS